MIVFYVFVLVMLVLVVWFLVKVVWCLFLMFDCQFVLSINIVLLCEQCVQFDIELVEGKILFIEYI